MSRNNSLSLKNGRLKKEPTKSKVRGHLEDLPAIETVFPFLHFQPDVDHSSPESAVSHPFELDLRSSFFEDSFGFKEDWHSFPIYSQHDWVWLGEDGFDEPPLEPICGAFLSEPIGQSTAQKNFNARYKRHIGKQNNVIGNFPSNSMESVHFASPHEPIDLSINTYQKKVTAEKQDYVKKVRFSDQQITLTRKRAEPDLQRSRKEATISNEHDEVRGLFLSPERYQTLDSEESSSRKNLAQKYAPSVDPVHSKHVKETRKIPSIECIRFDNAADIQAFASSLLSKNESKSTASNKSKKSSVTPQSSTYRQRKTYCKSRKNLALPANGSPLKDTRREDFKMKNLVVTTESADSENSSMEKTHTYSKNRKSRGTGSPLKDVTEKEDSMTENSRNLENRSVGASPDCEGALQCNSSGALSEADSDDDVESGVIQDQQQLRRSTRIHFRQAREKLKDFEDPYWWEKEWLE